MADYQLFIDGEYCDAASGETFATYEPATNTKFADVAKAGREDAERAIKAARKAFDEGPWPRMSGAERAAKLNKVADLIEANSEKLATAEARDGGGTMKKASFADIPGGAGAFRWFARCAEEQPDTIELEGTPFPPSSNYKHYEPHGVTTGHHPVELPVHHGVVEDRAIAGRGQLRRHQAGLVHLGDGPDAG